MKLTFFKQYLFLIFLVEGLLVGDLLAAPLRNCERVFSDTLVELSSPLTETSPQVTSELENIQKLVEQNPDKVITWAKKPLPGQELRFSQMKIVETGNSGAPFALIISGKIRFHFTRFVGAGKRGIVFMDTAGRAVKILQQFDQPRELLLQAWANSLWKKSGVQVPRIFEVDPFGNFLVQEYIPGENLFEKMNDEEPFRQLTPVIDQILAIRKTANEIYKNTGLYFDLKAANFILNAYGELVFVDCGPRLDENRNKYYQDPSGGKLSKALFLEYFLYRQARNDVIEQERITEEQLITQALQGESVAGDPLVRLQNIILRGESISPAGSHLPEAFLGSLKKENMQALVELAQQLWNPTSRFEVSKLLRGIRPSRLPSDEVMSELKRIRGQWKRLRSSFIALSREHRAPKKLDHLVTQMGKLRDAWKREDLNAADEIIVELRDLLEKKGVRAITQEVDGFQLDSERGFDRWLKDVRTHLKEAAQTEWMAPKALHEVRKDISELLAVAELKYALKPSLKIYSQLLFLRSMSMETGDWHDVFVISGAQVSSAYLHEQHEIPQEMRDRFLELAKKMRIHEN